MFYYGFINDQSICTGTYGFPTEVTIPNYIYIGTTDDKTVIGKKWTGNGWVEVIYYFYAQLNEKDLCIGVQEYQTEVIDARLIRIETLDESLIGFWYDRADSTFKPAPIRVLADHSTDVVNYRNEDRWLSDVLDEKANSLTIYSKTEADARFALKGEGGSVASDVIRLNGIQALFKTSSMMTLGTNNLETMIAGSKIYSKTSISVSSDVRLKEGIESVDTDRAIDFVRKLPIITYSYIGEDDGEKHMGVIAQQVQKIDPKMAKLFVSKSAEGYLAVDYASLVCPLILAVQRLSDEVERLKS